MDLQKINATPDKFHINRVMIGIHEKLCSLSGKEFKDDHQDVRRVDISQYPKLTKAYDELRIAYAAAKTSQKRQHSPQSSPRPKDNSTAAIASALNGDSSSMAALLSITVEAKLTEKEITAIEAYKELFKDMIRNSSYYELDDQATKLIALVSAWDVQISMGELNDSLSALRGILATITLDETKLQAIKTLGSELQDLSKPTVSILLSDEEFAAEELARNRNASDDVPPPPPPLSPTSSANKNK